MALFITFEGIEGCGKSTQSRRLYRRLHKLAISALLTHEPGVTILGRKITRMLKWNLGVTISPLTELMLFNASRAQHVEEVIRPALNEGKAVICDRFTDSSVAYQGYGRGLDIDVVKSANRLATGGLTPDITFLLDMPVAEGMKRKQGDKPDRFESEDGGFHERVKEGYLKLAEQEPERWVVLDASQKVEVVSGIIWHKVSRLI